MTSTDGIVWEAHSGLVSDWASVVYGNGMFVAIARSGNSLVMTSPDGINWTARNGVDGYWTSVTYGNGMFVAVAAGGNNRVMTSPDGIDWTAQASSGSEFFTSVTFANGTFVAVAFGGTNRVMTSSNPAPVPSGETYLCTTGAPSNSTPNFTITSGVVSAGGSCVGDVVIPAGVTSIEDNAFSGSELTSVTLPAGLTGIGNGAFAHTTLLTSITIPASVTDIGNFAFRFAGLTSITVESTNANFTSTSGVLFNKASTTIIAYPSKKVAASYSIPETVTSIVDHAFSDANLNSINIPASVTSIGNLALHATSSLSNITVDPANLYYSSIEGVLFNKGATTLITYPENKNATSYSIPETVTSIEEDAFQNASLTSITIPETVTSIGRYAFEGSQLTSVTIPSSVTTIEYGIFNGASSLTSVTIPSSITSIAAEAFRYASSLTNVYFLGDAPANVGTTPFVGTAVGAKAYIKSGASGFGNPGSTWNGLIVTNASVTYNTNGGSLMNAQVYDENISTPTSPTRAGYTFVGWSATNDGSAITFPYTPSVLGDITLYAKWTVAVTPSVTSATNANSSTKLVTFATSASLLTKDQKVTLNKLVTNSGKKATFVITGSAGKLPGVTDRAVKALAMKRGEVVKAYLVKLGVSKSKIMILTKITNQGIAPKTKILAKYLTS